MGDFPNLTVFFCQQKSTLHFHQIQVGEIFEFILLEFRLYFDVPLPKKREDDWSKKEKHFQKGGLEDYGDSRKTHGDRNYGAWICQFEGDFLLSICVAKHGCITVLRFGFTFPTVFKPNLRDMG